jgi:hypothetical protein
VVSLRVAPSWNTSPSKNRVNLTLSSGLSKKHGPNNGGWSGRKEELGSRALTWQTCIKRSSAVNE